MNAFPSRSDLFQIGRAAIAATPNIRINPSVVDVPGSDANLVVGTCAVMGEEVSARGAMALRGAFAELARGSALDRVLYDRYGLLRFSAQPATVDLVLSRPMPPGPTPGTIDAGSVVQTADGTQFGLDVDVTWGSGQLTATVSATALVNGSGGNVVAGTVTSWSTAPFDATITVTNPAPASGGIDTESGVQFLGRARGFFPTLARGTLGAIEFGAKQVPGIAVATATEIVNPNGYPAAVVQLVVGDQLGNASSDLLKAVATALLAYRAAGIFVMIIGGIVFQQAVTWALTFQSGTNEVLAMSRVQAVTVAISQYLAPGATLLRSALISAAQSVPGVIVSDSSLVIPAGDIVPTSPEQMIRVAAGDVTFV